jgi:hypothetical protein
MPGSIETVLFRSTEIPSDTEGVRDEHLLRVNSE